MSSFTHNNGPINNRQNIATREYYYSNWVRVRARRL